MQRFALAVLLGLAGGAIGASPLAAQGYRVRLDTRFQSVSYRGITVDSIPRSAAVTGPDGGLQSPDGFAVFCGPGEPYCSFFRPGASAGATPLVETVDATLWGFGVPGLQLRVNARGVTALGGAAWPGTQPAGQLLEGYAAYDNRLISARLGRTHEVTRFGWMGFDGARLEIRPLGRALRLFGYGGWGLARSFPLPVTSADLNPLGDSIPTRRQIVAAGGLGWSLPNYFEGRLVYQREGRSGANATVSERVAADWILTASPQVSLSGGGDYDLAASHWGKADLTLNYLTANDRLRFTLGGRRYRPYFDLWTVWGAFNPAAYSAATGSAALTVLDGLELRARGEYYRYDNTNTTTPLVTTRDNGWRTSINATLVRVRDWAFDAGYDREIGPGASSQGFDAAATYRPTGALLVTVDGSRLARPLEYRFDDVRLWSYGLRLDYEAAASVRLTADVRGYNENRERPDAGQLSWSQLRLNLGATIVLGSGSDSRRLHPAILRIPEGRRPK